MNLAFETMNDQYHSLVNRVKYGMVAIGVLVLISDNVILFSKSSSGVSEEKQKLRNADGLKHRS